MEKYIEFVLRRPVLVILIILSITAFLISGIPKIGFDNSTESMMPKRDPHYLDYKKVKAIYGNIGKFVIMSINDDNILSESFFSELNNLITDIEEYKVYDEEKEKTRIGKLDAVIEKGALPYSSFINAFKEDPSFQRELIRISQSLHDDMPQELDRKDLKKIQEAFYEIVSLKESEKIATIISPLTAKDISGKDDTLSTYDLIETDEMGNRIIPKTMEDFKAFKERLSKNPVFEKSLYVKDPANGKITDFGLLVKFKNLSYTEDIANRVWDIAVSYQHLSITAQGIPIVKRFINDYIKQDLLQFLPLVLFVVVVVFYFNFKSVRGVILPFFTLSTSVLWILGLMGHLGIKLTAIGVSLPPLMIAVGSSYSIHVLNQYFIDYNAITNMGKEKGLKLSMAHISTTVFLAGFTTFIGFFSLASNQVRAIREWGIFSAIGVLFAVFIATSMLPACLMLMPHKDRRRRNTKNGGNTIKETWIEPVIRLFIRVSTRHYRAVITITLIVIFLSLAGISRIKVETSFMSQFKKDDYIRISSKQIGDKYGGYVGLSILIDSGEPDGINDPEFLNLIEEIRQWLLLDPSLGYSIGRADAFPDVIKTMHRAMNNDDISYYKIPEDRITIEEYMELYAGEDENSDGRPDEFESYFDPDYKTIMIFARLRETETCMMTTHDMAEITKKISRYLDEKLKDTYSYKITGEPVIIVQLSKHVVKGQLTSLVLCIIVVSIIVVLLFRNFKAGLVSCIPMGIAVTINFGIMGWFGIRLDSATAIIASITIGIGIDDTIHFLNTYRQYKGKGQTLDETLASTLSTSGKAITYTSLALIFGHVVLITSKFMPIILFGLLISISMVATTLGALIVLPATIKATGVDLEESTSESMIWKFLNLRKVFDFGNSK